MDSASDTNRVEKAGSADVDNTAGDMSHLVVSEVELVSASGTIPTESAPLPESDAMQTDEQQDIVTPASVVVTSSTQSNGDLDPASGVSQQPAVEPAADISMSVEPTLPSTNGHSNAEAGPSSSTIPFIPAGSPFNNGGLSATSTSLATIYRTGYIWDPMMMLHCPEGYVPTDEDESVGSGHPEEPMRIYRIFRKLADQGAIKRMLKLDYTEVSEEQVLQIHTQELWDKVHGQECALVSFIRSWYSRAIGVLMSCFRSDG